MKTTALNELNILMRLTAVEANTARTRVSQASDEATRRELLANADKADDRSQALREAIVERGGVPDLLGVGVAKATNAARLPLEQALPLTEALLSDLALEHQLFDRARLVKVLAHESGDTGLVRLAERLEKAHTATIEWLFTVLGETAVGGPAALRPTATQAAAAFALRGVTLASGATVKTVNRAAAQASQLSSTVAENVSSVGDNVSSTAKDQLDRARQLGRSGRKVLRAGRNAALGQAEVEAGKPNVPGTTAGVHNAREEAGAVAASELPVRNYDSLSAGAAQAAVEKLATAHEVRTVLAYERTHKNRTSVLSAGAQRTAEIAKSLVAS